MALTVRYSGGHSVAAPGTGGFDNGSGPHITDFPHSIEFTAATTVTGLKINDLGGGNFELLIEGTEL